MAKKSIADVNASGMTVLMRVDFNVPLKDGKITNDKRIQAAIPSIKKVLDEGGKLVLMSHLGRPKGKVNMDESLKPAAQRLGELLGKEVRLGPAEEIAGDEAKQMASDLQPGQVLCLENVRFDAREESKDEAVAGELGAQMARMADVYVNDAFGTCHRKHASMYAAARAVQAKGGPAVAGFLVEKEIRYLHEAVSEPKRPFVAILGGAKVSDKIKLISSLLEKVDKILIGGAMAYTLLKSKGHEVGASRVEDDQVEAMKDILSQAGDKIALPRDHVGAASFESDEAKEVTDVEIPADLMGLDIGPKTVEAFGKEIAAAKTIVWNGPMGVFEREAYANGTRKVAQAVADATDAGAISVIGGGDSATAVEEFGLEDKMTHVSTGGGASLTYLEGKPMPPIEVLDEK
jgi:3-phosphoglycerate kinase